MYVTDTSSGPANSNLGKVGFKEIYCQGEQRALTIDACAVKWDRNQMANLHNYTGASRVMAHLQTSLDSGQRLTAVLFV